MSVGIQAQADCHCCDCRAMLQAFGAIRRTIPPDPHWPARQWHERAWTSTPDTTQMPGHLWAAGRGPEVCPDCAHLTTTGLIIGVLASRCLAPIAPSVPEQPHLTKTSLMLGAPWPLVPDANCPRMNPIEMNDPPQRVIFLKAHGFLNDSRTD